MDGVCQARNFNGQKKKRQSMISKLIEKTELRCKLNKKKQKKTIASISIDNIVICPTLIGWTLARKLNIIKLFNQVSQLQRLILPLQELWCTNKML